MALFLFLVCSVLAAVIFSAATAASGRAAGLAESDQEYYNVMSAAELFRDLMGGDGGAAVQVQCVRSTQLGQDEASPSPDNVTTTCAIGPGSAGATTGTAIEAVGAQSPLLEQAAKSIVLADMPPDESLADYAFDWQFAPAASSTPLLTRSLKLDHSVTGADADVTSLLDQVKITETIEPDGNIVFHFEGNPSKRTSYAAELICKASTETGAQERIVRKEGKRVRTEVKTTVITWEPSELKQISAGGAQADDVQGGA